MRTLVYTNPNGQSVQLDQLGPYFIRSLLGVDQPPVKVMSQKAPYQDGETYIASPLDIRRIVVEGTIVKRTLANQWAFRQALVQAMNPTLGPGNLVLYRDQQPASAFAGTPDGGTLAYTALGGTWALGTFTRTAGYGGDWYNCTLRSNYSLGAGASALATMPSLNAYTVGLHNSNTDSPGNAIKFGIVTTQTGQVSVQELGITYPYLTTYGIGDVLSVFYDGLYMHYRKNGTDFRVVYVGSGQSLYYYAAIYGTGNALNAVTFYVPAGNYFPDNRLQVTALPIGPVFSNKTGLDPFIDFQLTFEAFDPYWYAFNTSQINSVFVTGNMIWPNLTFPRVKSTRVSATFPATSYGDVPTPVTIVINGPCSNPKVQNLTTNQYIKVNKVLNTGEKLIVYTGFGKKSIQYVQVGGATSLAMQYLDLASTFWQLNPGLNNLAFSDDSGSSTQTCVVSWQDRYLGV